MNIIALVSGGVLAVGTALLGRWVGFDRGRSYYPVVLIVTASYYLLFAAEAASVRAVMIESVVIAGFATVSILGFRRNLRLVVVGLIGHGGFDLLHGHIINNPGVPIWWPTFCLSYDVALGVLLALAIARGVVAEND